MQVILTFSIVFRHPLPQFITPDLHTSETVVACQYLGVLTPHDCSSSLNSSLLDSAQKAPKLVLDDEEDDPHDFLNSLATAAHDARVGDPESEEEGTAAVRQEEQLEMLHPKRRSRRHRGEVAGSDHEDDVLSLSVTSSPPLSHLDESSQPPPSPLILRTPGRVRQGDDALEEGVTRNPTVMAAFNDILLAAAGVEAEESVSEMKEHEDLPTAAPGVGAESVPAIKKKAKSSSVRSSKSFSFDLSQKSRRR